MKNSVIAIVPAAGLGKRFGEGANKPFAGLGDKPLIIWAVEALQVLPEITEIIPAVKETDTELCRRLFEDYSITKIKRFAAGGRERQDSVFNGLSLIEDRTAIVLVHDGVRPLIEPSVIRKVLQQLNGCDGVVVGVPLKDTVKEVTGGIVKSTPERDRLWAIQTPQAFHFQALLACGLPLSQPLLQPPDHIGKSLHRLGCCRRCHPQHVLPSCMPQA